MVVVVVAVAVVVVVVVVVHFGESMAVEILVWRNFCCTLGMLPWKNWRLLGQNLEGCFGKIHISKQNGPLTLVPQSLS